MWKDNGLSGKAIYLTEENNDLRVIKEKNNNWKSVKEVIEILTAKNFLRMPKFLGEEENQYVYEYLKGITYNQVISMSMKQIYQILDFVLEYQSLFTDSQGNVIVHGDLSQVNVIFDVNSKLPIKIIDWDGAYFGNQYDDIGYICWLWVNLGDPKIKNETKRKKLSRIFQYLNYDFQDVLEIKKSIVLRIKKDSQNIKQVERKQFLEDWYDYCIKWVEDNFNENLFTS